jgi:hypothetical protein
MLAYFSEKPERGEDWMPASSKLLYAHRVDECATLFYPGRRRALTLTKGTQII